MKELVKKCSNCGWTYSYKHPGRTCGICHAPMLKTVCPTCGKFVPEDMRTRTGRAYCVDCFHKYLLAKHNRIMTGYDEAYDNWLQEVRKIPKPYKLITEEQWLRACKHFCGCAICGKDEISARGFFIPFKDGGRYCDWNVIPMCERCASSTIRTNTWRRLHNHKPIRDKLIEYLRPILEERVNEARET